MLEYKNWNTNIRDLRPFAKVAVAKEVPISNLGDVAMREVPPTGGVCSAVSTAAEESGRTLPLQDPPRNMSATVVSQASLEAAFTPRPPNRPMQAATSSHDGWRHPGRCPLAGTLLRFFTPDRMEMPPAAALPWIVLGAFSMLFQLTGAQGISPHSEQQAIFGDRRAASEATFDDRNRMTHGSPAVHSRNCLMRKQVYGWHPAWSGTAYQDYDFGLLSTVSYYSYEVDPETGGYHTLHQWRETKLVEMAHHFGTQVELTASLSGEDVQALLGNPTACTTLTDSLVALVKEKDADGVCIDFDGMTSANAKTFAGLVQLLAGKLRQWRNSATVSVTLPGKDTDRGYDFPQLLPAVTRFIVKTYDARPSTSAIAGPLAPLHPGTVWGDGGFEKSLNDYLQAGVPRAKLLAGIPYFGYDWRTASDKPGAKTSGKARIVLLRDYEKMDSSAYLLWDTASTTGWLPRSSEGRSRQLWIDQVSSLTEKYAMVKQMDVAGVGIWALGYDHGSARYWNLLRGQFADCSATETDELARDSKPATPGLEGPTSAERNVWNWAWMLGGGLVAIVIIWAVKKYL